MPENTKTDELRQKIVVTLYNASDERDNKSVGEAADEIMQLINSEVNQALDNIQSSSDKGMYIGDRPADVLANHRKVIDEAVAAVRNKYPLNNGYRGGVM